MLLYLAATNQVVSAALVAQREVDEEAVATAEPADDEPKIPLAGPGAGKARPPAESDTIRAAPAQPSEVVQKKKMMQHPVYFVSSLLQGARSRYSGVQKLLFGLLMASRKLRHYFQAHEILSSPPLVATDTAQTRCDRKDCGMGLGVVELWVEV